MKILVINGPNINMLGIREPQIYGSETYANLLEKIQKHADELSVSVTFFQSNHEGAIIDKIQEGYKAFDGIIINPAAYTHTSIAIADALASVSLPSVEVHISDVSKREDFREISYVRPHCIKTISGHGTDGYTEALTFLYEHIKNQNR